MAELQSIDIKTLKVYQLSGSSAGSSSGDYYKYRTNKLYEQNRLDQLHHAHQAQLDRIEYQKQVQHKNSILQQQAMKRSHKRNKKKSKLLVKKQFKQNQINTNAAGENHKHPVTVNQDNTDRSNYPISDGNVGIVPRVKQHTAVTIVDADE